jgi:hypothetical protein
MKDMDSITLVMRTVDVVRVVSARAAAANVAAAASVAVATAGSGVTIRPRASKSVN